MRTMPATMIVFALLIGAASAAFGGDNPQVTLPLHARLSGGSCTAFNPVNCVVPNLPLVDVQAGTDYQIYVLFMNYTAVAGVQTAFDWPADWVLQEANFNCREGQLNGSVPSAPGPTTGTIASAFTCHTAGTLATIGRLLFTTGASGCLSQVQSSFPDGDHVVDCDLEIDQIDANDNTHQQRLGMICVGGGGRHACNPVSPVEPATWGQIKATYER